jgi:hypothetical protein
MVVSVNGRTGAGDARSIRIGAEATTLDGTAYQVAIYEGAYATAAPHNESDADMTHSPGNAIFAAPFRDFSFVWENGDASGDAITYQVWVNNRMAKPPTDPTDMDKVNFGWSQLGSDTIITQNQSDAATWTGRFRWLCIVAKANANTANQQEAVLTMIS